MHVTLNDVVDLMNKIAPADMAEAWDNVGLMLGRRKTIINRIMVALDITPEVVEQAINSRIDLIITHHPLIFKPLRSLSDDQWQQSLLLTLAEHNIAVYSAHTNLDAVNGGVNDALAQALELQDDDILDDDSNIGRIGNVKTTSLEEFAARVKKKLGADYVVVGNAGKSVCRVAVCGGAGCDFIDIALAKGADTLVTGDVKYHDAQKAVYSGLNIIDAGHQATERLVLEEIADRLSIHFTQLNWNIAVLIADQKLLLKHI